jgi:2'-5' RNA ligase
VRAFLAAPPDADWVGGAREWTARVRASSPSASWTRAETWHVTLRFFAEISEEQAAMLAERVAPRAAAIAEGDLAVAGAVVLPPRGPARVLGVGFEPSSTLEALASLVEEAESAARAAGLSAHERPFRPHVTFARIRRPWPVSAVSAYRREADAWRSPPFRARAVVLYRSRLEPGGPVHTPLQEWRFSGARSGVGA